MLRELGYVGCWESALFEYTNVKYLPSFYTVHETHDERGPDGGYISVIARKRKMNCITMSFWLRQLGIEAHRAAKPIANASRKCRNDLMQWVARASMAGTVAGVIPL